MLKGNCLIAQSGGPTAAINATLCGAYDKAEKMNEIETVYGGLNGILGIMDGKLIDLNPILGNEENKELLMTTPSSFLGSCRYKLKGEEDYKKIFEVFEKYNIRYFFYIGGNDSMDTILQLKAFAAKQDYEIMLMGMPKTIDNDLTEIDHTPGFGSSAKFIATTIKEIACDTNVYDINSIIIAEVMGRHAGWLALSAALATDREGNCLADLIYVPEVSFEYDKFLDDLKLIQKNKKQIIVVVSEGLKDKNGKFLSEISVMGEDMFGHVQLGGTAKYIENRIREDLNVKVRSVEINVLQRCAAHIVSATDIDESFIIGQKGVEYAVEGNSGKMVVSRRVEGFEYKLEYDCEEIEKIANNEKCVPLDYLNDKKNHVSQKAIDYLSPLIKGEKKIKYENGLPVYLFLKEFID